MSALSAAKAFMKRSSSRVATIDAAKAAPPPSPLAPVDLTDPAQVTGVMEIAARIGDMLISSGTSNSDARAQVFLACSAYGLHYCHVNIVMDNITIHTYIDEGANRRPLTVMRSAQGVSVDFSKLAAVDNLIRDIHAGRASPAMAEKRLAEIENQAPPYSERVSLLGWGIMGGFISVMLGGDLLVGVMSFVLAVVIMGTNSWLGKKRLPPFYQNMVGGFIAVVPAAILYSVAGQFNIQFSPSQIIGMGIVVLVAGLTLVQCIVDGITKAPVTSSARFFEAFLSTGAIIGGVGMGIQFSEMIGFSLPPLETIAPPVYYQIPFLVLCGGIGSAGFAMACYASWSEVVVSGLTAAGAMIFYYATVALFGFGGVVASGLAAIIVGLGGGLMARRFFIPPLVTMIVGYTPMLPGLTLYRGMYATLNEQMITGFTNLATALAISGALAAGVVFGERIARRLRRPQYFRPYTQLKRLGQHSVRRANQLAHRAHRRGGMTGVPMSPFVPRRKKRADDPESANAPEATQDATPMSDPAQDSSGHSAPIPNAPEGADAAPEATPMPDEPIAEAEPAAPTTDTPDNKLTAEEIDPTQVHQEDRPVGETVYTQPGMDVSPRDEAEKMAQQRAAENSDTSARSSREG